MTDSALKLIEQGVDPAHTHLAEGGIVNLFRLMGEDPEREGLTETPARFVRAMLEMTKGYRDDPAKILSTDFDASHNGMNYDQMIVVRDIRVESMCEHHLMTFVGLAQVGYLPRNRVVGLSKIPRLVNCYARRLQLQERLTMQIASALMENLDALGAGVVVKARHECMCRRGVRAEGAEMQTSALLGTFRDEPEVRSEFLRLIGK
jgi:GTP cyclohydrolase I